MNAEDIIVIDERFDFTKPFKRNYCTLLNFKLDLIEISLKFLVDDKLKTLEYKDSPLFKLVYREWQNPNWFDLGNLPGEPNIFFSSPGKAWEWFENNKEKFGIVDLNYTEAINTAKIYIETNKRI